MRFEIGDRVRLGVYGPGGVVEGFAAPGPESRRGNPIVRYDNGLILATQPHELIAGACPIREAPDATPDEARAILAELHAVTSSELPIAEVPFSLAAPVNTGRGRAVQRGLFDGGE